MNRLETTFAELKKQKRAGLITYIMAFDPDEAASFAILKDLPAAGADIIELGMPFSDPMADGKTIQAAGIRALKAGATLKKILKMVKAFRETDTKTPLILMGYYNPVYRYGAKAFAQDAKTAGVDGVLLVDLPPEEEEEFTSVMGDLQLVRLIAPTTGEKRLPGLLKNAKGFIYYIAVTGITGGKSADIGALKNSVTALKTKTALPVAVGFGIKTPAQVKEVAAFADAVVVGSALVEVIAQNPKKPEAALDFVRQLAAALK